MRSVCNVRMPHAMGDVISGIGIGIAAADSIGCLHGIGLTLVDNSHSGSLLKWFCWYCTLHILLTLFLLIKADLHISPANKLTFCQENNTVVSLVCLFSSFPHTALTAQWNTVQYKTMQTDTIHDVLHVKRCLVRRPVLKCWQRNFQTTAKDSTACNILLNTVPSKFYKNTLCKFTCT